MTSIASVADTAEEKFVPYYDLFMPSLKHIVENAVQKELRLLRGKTIECISLIGLAVGKEKVSDLSTVCWVCCVSSGFGGIEGTRRSFLSDKRFSEDLWFPSSYSCITLILYINYCLHIFIANKVSS